MEPLYPQNILERTFPHLREQREKAEKEFLTNSISEKSDDIRAGSPVIDDELLYFDVPYKGGPAGRNLSTFA